MRNRSREGSSVVRHEGSDEVLRHPNRATGECDRPLVAPEPQASPAVDRWQLVGNGDSATAIGGLQLAEMTVVTVPESATDLVVLASLAGGGSLVGRRRWRA